VLQQQDLWLLMAADLIAHRPAELQVGCRTGTSAIARPIVSAVAGPTSPWFVRPMGRRPRYCRPVAVIASRIAPARRGPKSNAAGSFLDDQAQAGQRPPNRPISDKSELMASILRRQCGRNERLKVTAGAANRHNQLLRAAHSSKSRGGALSCEHAIFSASGHPIHFGPLSGWDSSLDRSWAPAHRPAPVQPRAVYLTSLHRRNFAVLPGRIRLQMLA
jgi:hypothetical protein